MPLVDYFHPMFLLTFWQTLVQWDQTGLFYINQVFSNSFFDAIMPWMRESVTWVPLYLFFLLFAPLNFGRFGWYWAVFVILTVTLTDQVSSSLIKQWVGRVRPCNDPFMIEFIKLRVARCSGGFSFTSSHAANHFGVAMFMVSTLKKQTGKMINWLFVWAAIISYAQMYVGVHYPLDVLGGTAVGLGIGFIVAKWFNAKVGLGAAPVMI